MITSAIIHPTSFSIVKVASPLGITLNNQWGGILRLCDYHIFQQHFTQVLASIEDSYKYHSWLDKLHAHIMFMKYKQEGSIILLDIELSKVRVCGSLKRTE